MDFSSLQTVQVKSQMIMSKNEALRNDDHYNSPSLNQETILLPFNNVYTCKRLEKLTGHETPIYKTVQMGFESS